MNTFLAVLMVLGFCLSGSSFAGTSVPPTREAIWAQLSTVHAPAWSIRPETDEQRKEYFKLLTGIFLDPRGLVTEETPNPREQKILRSAFTEAGKFAVSSEGKFFDEASVFYADAIDRAKKAPAEQHNLRVDLFESLTNTGVPEAATGIAELLQPGLSSNTFGLSRLGVLFSEKTKDVVDPDSKVLPYRPNVGQAYAARKRQPEWIQSKSVAQTRLKALVDADAETPEVKALAQTLTGKIAGFGTVSRNEPGPAANPATNSAAIAQTQAAGTQRTPANDADKPGDGAAETQTQTPVRGILAGVMIALVAFFLFRKKSRN